MLPSINTIYTRSKDPLRSKLHLNLYIFRACQVSGPSNDFPPIWPRGRIWHRHISSRPKFQCQLRDCEFLVPVVKSASVLTHGWEPCRTAATKSENVKSKGWIRPLAWSDAFQSVFSLSMSSSMTQGTFVLS